MSEARLRTLAALVTQWSKKINLVSKNDVALLWERHIEDSLALIPYIPAGVAFAIDLGSGAGFPGLVLAIATGIPFTLIEADARKAAFLLEAARQTGAPAKVLNERIETAKTAPALLVTARALAPLDRLLHLAVLHLAPGGVCLFPKGETVDAELAQARRQWQMDEVQYKSVKRDGACILKVSNISHAGPATTHYRDI